MTTTVVNKHHRVPFDIYIGRGSIWGNPFVIGEDGDRAEVIEKYDRYLDDHPELVARIPELRGKTLACFCAPKSCHGDILARRADRIGEKRDMMRIGTDGGCHPNPGGPGGWAWVAEDGRYGCGSFSSGTNNIAELTAIKEALIAHPNEPVIIEYDSQYAANCVKDWGPKWRRRGETDKKNLELVFSILDVVDDRSDPIRWEWVRGHDVNNSHPLNTAADELATRMRKVGRETRESGSMVIDLSRTASVQSGRARPSKPSRSEMTSRSWGNMTDIGGTRGLTAREVGNLLRSAGLLDRQEPTKLALDSGAAKWFERRRDGVLYPRWNIDITNEMLDRLV